MTDQSKSIIGGLPITVEDLEGAARRMIDHAVAARGKDLSPLYSTSANGQVLSMCALQPDVKALFEEADIIHADGEPLVHASKLLAKSRLPERVATTDLIHNTARMAEAEAVSFYFLGASQDEIERAVANMKARYPKLIFAGYRNGYIKPDEEDAVIEQVNAAKPDILWIGMGVPREQDFVSRNKAPLHWCWRHQDLWRSVQLPVRQKQTRTAMDAGLGAGMGLSHRSGAKEALLAVCLHQPPCGLAFVDENPLRSPCAHV